MSCDVINDKLYVSTLDKGIFVLENEQLKPFFYSEKSMALKQKSREINKKKEELEKKWNSLTDKQKYKVALATVVSVVSLVVSVVFLVLFMVLFYFF
jgi:hypothetical protein